MRNTFKGLLPYGTYVARTIFIHTLAFNNDLKGLSADHLRYSILSRRWISPLLTTPGQSSEQIQLILTTALLRHCASMPKPISLKSSGVRKRMSIPAKHDRSSQIALRGSLAVRLSTLSPFRADHGMCPMTFRTESHVSCYFLMTL